ncbi:MAG: group II intron reverse transcriptase/maturase [Bacteroidales bacterium]|nr:group II intron reverse transcriptase/maturase [Candidatus Latescibacterota bacterium]
MSSSNSLTPTGDLDAWRVTESSPFDFASVEYIVSNASITEAWKKVRSNKGAPGADGICIEKFQKWVRPQWHDIKKQLLDGTYVPSPALRVEIPKESGGVRRLGIPRVLDRVLMQAIAMVLGEMFNPTFSDNSFGYMPHRSVQQAVRQAQSFYRQGYTIQIDIDLEKFFDTVNHDVLMERVARKVKNKGLLRLLGRFLRAGVMVDGRLRPTRLGVPQGSPVSPILSNILLDDLDKELEKRGHKFIRYADDLAIFVKSKRAGERVMASISRYLECKLKVKVNQAKSKVSPVKESSVLGFEIHHKKLRTLDCKVRKFKRELKLITRRCPGISIGSRIIRLKHYAQGWMAHYGCGLKYNDAVALDGWMRRRLRMCYWKQWRRPRRRIRALINLGVNKREAIRLGLSRKSYWRLSKTLATNSGLSNAHFDEIGLISLRTLWCKIHHPATAR